MTAQTEVFLHYDYLILPSYNFMKFKSLCYQSWEASLFGSEALRIWLWDPESLKKQVEGRKGLSSVEKLKIILCCLSVFHF